MIDPISSNPEAVEDSHVVVYYYTGIQLIYIFDRHLNWFSFFSWNFSAGYYISFGHLSDKWDFHVLFLTFQNGTIDLPSRPYLSLPLLSWVMLIFVFAVLCTKARLLIALTWSCIVIWSSSFSLKLTHAADLLEGNRRKQRSPRSSGMPWPMRKPGSWQRGGKWRWKIARLPKSWRNVYTRNSRWDNALGTCEGHLL